MESLTRRTFLVGVAKAAAAGGLIVAASDSDVQQFAGVGSQVSVLAKEQPEWILSGQIAYARLSVGQRLYDEHGSLVAVVTEVMLERVPYDVTSMDDRYERFRLGSFRQRAQVVTL